MGNRQITVLTFIYALLPEGEPPVIVGLETAAEMNLVRIGTNEFFPNSPLLNFRKPSTTTQEIERILLCYVHEQIRP
jgi:hypothetical protein